MGRCVVRGVRGAINVMQNSRAEILSSTRELLIKMAKANGVRKEDIASIFFSVTGDLNAVFPAEAARELGWTEVPLFCAVEIPVPGSLPLCIRVLFHINTELPQSAIKHIYLREARVLRADLAANNT